MGPNEVDYLKITDSASDYLLKIFDNFLKKDKESEGIRISLRREGCSGLSYNIECANNHNITNFDDYIPVNDKLKIFIDPKISFLIINSTLDYIERDDQRGIVFINPNEKGKCGCGSSFYV